MQKAWLLMLAAILMVGCGDKPADEGAEDSASASKIRQVALNSAGAADAKANLQEDEDDDEKPAENISAAKVAKKALADLQKAYRQAKAEYEAKLKEASDEEKAELLKQNPADDFAKEFLKLADACSDAAMQSRLVAAREGSGPIAAKALDKMAKADPNGRQVSSVFAGKNREMPSVEKEMWFEAVVASARQDSVKAYALYGQLQMYDMITQGMDYLEDPGFVEQLPEVAEYLRTKKGTDFDAVTEPLLAELESKYADVALGRRSTIGKEVENIRFVRNFLSVGKEAPDIAGEDLDGVEFKLSDYRGKVVLLDFWGDW